MEYTQITLNEWVEMKQKLKRELLGVKHSFVRIGYALRKIDDQKFYEQDGYKSIVEFAKAEYGLEPSTTSRFMSINREYSIDGYSEKLRPEFEDLGRSQLEEMLKLPESDRQMIKPEASREAIRELKRFNAAEPEEGVADDIKELLIQFFEEHPEELNAVFEYDAPQTEAKKLAERINPGGNRSYRKGMFFLMFYKTKISVKKFGHPPQEMTWEEFIRRTVEIFGEAAGPDTWKNYFGGEENAQDPEDIPENQDAQEPERGEGENDERDCESEQHDDGRDFEAAAEEPEGRRQEAEARDTPELPEIEERQEIAPAQRSPKTAESLEEKPVQSVVSGVEKEVIERVMNPPVMEKPMGSRKDYLDSLTVYGAAEYIAREYKAHRLKASSLAYPNELEQWLEEQVDQGGRPWEE